MKEPYNLGVTLTRAQEILQDKDPAQIAKAVKVEWDAESNTFSIPSLGKVITVDTATWDVFSEPGQKVDRITQILVLHYLQCDLHTPLTGTLMAFKELPSAFIYNEPFRNRAIQPLVRVFGEKPTLLSKVGKILGGSNASFKDESISLYPFPMIPLTFVIHWGDEEFPPAGNILFDASINKYLTVEDCTVLASWVVRQLSKEALNT